MSTEHELSKDLEELQKFRSGAVRPRVQKLLDVEIKNVKQALEKAKAENKKAVETPKPGASSGGSSQNVPTKKITTFAFDESPKFVKLYYTLPGVQTLPKESIESTFTDNSFHVYVKNLNGTNYILEATGLTDYIEVEKSTIKQKTDMVLVMLKKIKENVDWGKLLALEKKEPAVDMPKFDEGGDPQASLMKMMKSMYDTGDDEMKRSIKKAFYESNQKKQAGGIGDFDM